MAPRKTPKSGSPSPGARREAKHGGNKNGKKEGLSGSSFFTWFMVIALLGVWTSVAVVWFELVDYEEVLAKAKDFRYNLSEVLQGKLGIYDADGDGDFDVEDAKALLGLTKDGSNENIDSLEEVLNILAEESSDWFYGFLSFLYDVITPFEIIEEEESDAADDVDGEQPGGVVKRKAKVKGLKERSVPEQQTLRDAEEVIQPAKEPHVRAEHRSAEPEAEPEDEDEIQTLLRQVLDSQFEKISETDEEHVHDETNFQEENNEISEVPTVEEDYDGDLEDKMPEVLETPGSVHEEPASDYQPGEPDMDDSHVTYEYHTHAEEDTYESEGPDDTELTLEDALEHNADGERLTEHYYEHIQEPIDSTDQTHENEADLPDSVTEHIQSIDEREHADDQVADQPHDTEVPVQVEDYSNDDLVGQSEKETQQKEKVKKKKPKLLNKFDKGIKAEFDAAEKLRKKGKAEEALKAFEALVSKYPQSPRARYGKAQSEDDLAEKVRSNEILQQSISTYGEVASLPNVPDDLIKLTLTRRADREQFLGRMRGSLVTLQKLVSLFPNDTSFKNNLGVGYLLIGDNNNAKRVYEEVLSLAPNDGFAKVHYGFILKAENKIAESIPYLKEGLESGDPGTDDGRFYFHLGDAMQRVGNKEAYKWYELGHQRGHFASVWQRSLYNVKGLKAQPWWTAKETGYTELVKSLERNWKAIRDEGLAVMDRGKGLFLPEDENLREKGDWSQFTLWQQGRKNENACKSVPKTCALLERFPEATGCRRGQIKYSVMHPGTHVWPHTGPTNCRLRMHLGLVIPKEGCRIRCAKETRFWEEGKVLIFDDSFEHEVWQDADAYRLIFIVDVWHPELTPQQRRTLPAI
ncbi:aspartyl/asparaginyl beta-hydroxylase isoform X2 [Rhineura floridana]|uniref:aspartyl/asparaginyl beta-hydroxylase isoform X2 n=1 Tax=Rhineura floridana TaxID=261503 RepID=UPI002AC8030B|nr:aspartyl/asparaginyl beta-hydroxylase isoform X2 [Rhineura floridana]